MAALHRIRFADYMGNFFHVLYLCFLFFLRFLTWQLLEQNLAFLEKTTDLFLQNKQIISLALPQSIAVKASDEISFLNSPLPL